MSAATIGRWGKSLAVRLPQDIAKTTGFGEGAKIEMAGRRGELVIRPARATSIEAMFAGKSPEEWRRLYSEIEPQDADVGREVVEE